MHWLASSVTIPISWTDSNAPFAKWTDKSMPDPEDIGGYMSAWLIISLDNLCLIIHRGSKQEPCLTVDEHKVARGPLESVRGNGVPERSLVRKRQPDSLDAELDELKAEIDLDEWWDARVAITRPVETGAAVPGNSACGEAHPPLADNPHVDNPNAAGSAVDPPPKRARRSTKWGTDSRR